MNHTSFLSTTSVRAKKPVQPTELKSLASALLRALRCRSLCSTLMSMLGHSRSLERDISPPAKRRDRRQQDELERNKKHYHEGSSSIRRLLAAIEAGQVVIDDHLAQFSAHFQAVERNTAASFPTLPRLTIADFKQLYQRNLHPQGRHFVVHQHDHPISGVHYDLRLQFSHSSTISFAIPYGLPGNASSVRPNRMAIETRVHNLWNNLIESASRATGSLLIWDTGEYDVLPYREERKMNNTDDELTDEESSKTSTAPSASERLFHAFQDKHIRLRLHGCRLPAGYTISLRLPQNNHQGHAKDPARKRRRFTQTRPRSKSMHTDSESNAEDTEEPQDENDVGNASDDEEEASIRLNNAYTGASNTIGSIHQRHWFLSLDRQNSALKEPFFVMGRDVERSVVTGRCADDILADEGVTRFIGRKMWRPIIA